MKKVGIWIDQKAANVISIDENQEQTQTIYSEIESRERFPGEGKQFGRFGDQYLVKEKKQTNQFNQQLKKYLSSVVDAVKDSDEILVFGPAQTKKELEKLMLEKPDLTSKLNAVISAEQMTDNQKVAYVRDYFKKTK
jgi:hypothetical protein